MQAVVKRDVTVTLTLQEDEATLLMDLVQNPAYAFQAATKEVEFCEKLFITLRNALVPVPVPAHPQPGPQSYEIAGWGAATGKRLD